MTPEAVIQTVIDSGLRGRGGAGFPAGKKWSLARKSAETPKFVICNADEGDPGAFMNRRVLESDPHALIEGMIIAAYAIGASRGYIYCRAEYPLAVKTLNIGILQARELGLLGENILGSDFSFDLEVRMGAGAFVCGEETALMASIEGKRGEPRTRPPFPAQKGLFGKPSNVNNVETYANVPQIILRGRHGLLNWAPRNQRHENLRFGWRCEEHRPDRSSIWYHLREIVYDVGGGIKDDSASKPFKLADHPGGCIPAQYIDTPVDYDSLRELGSIMGSGGMIVMDEETCMVDIARYFMEFTQDESCGKCIPCRVGTRRILEILERICEGKGQHSDIEHWKCSPLRSNQPACVV
jgi:NADH:ubiquinone oxidoreductase subunit F (NADH-binding)